MQWEEKLVFKRKIKQKFAEALSVNPDYVIVFVGINNPYVWKGV